MQTTWRWSQRGSLYCPHPDGSRIASEWIILEAHMLTLTNFERIHGVSGKNSYSGQSDTSGSSFIVGMVSISASCSTAYALLRNCSRMQGICCSHKSSTSRFVGLFSAQFVSVRNNASAHFSTSSLGSGLSGVAFSNTLRMVGMHGSYIGYMYPSLQVCQSFGVLSGRWYEPAGMGLRMVSRWLVQKCLTLTILPCTPYLTRVSHWSFHQSSHGLPQPG